MIKQLFELWLSSPPEKKLMILTGEGISISSGIKKENKGDVKSFWGKAPKSEFLNIETLENTPEKLWSWCLEKRVQLANIEPNHSHLALLSLEEFFKDNFTLITENIDGLHSKAGNYRIIEMFGSILKNKILEKEKNGEHFHHHIIPKNKQGQFLRPDIVLEGESPERKKVLQAHILAQQTDIFLIIENSLEKNALYDLPLIAKKFNNAKIIEINSEKQFCEYSDIYIHMKSEDILPILVNLMIDLEKGIRKNTNI